MPLGAHHHHRLFLRSAVVNWKTMSLFQVGFHTARERTRIGLDVFQRFPRTAATCHRSLSTNPNSRLTMTKSLGYLAQYAPIYSRSLGRRYHSGGYYGGGHESVMRAYWFYLFLNLVPFGLYQYATMQKDRKLEGTVLRNCVVSPESVESGRWWTLLTSAFMHTDPYHFAFNMIAAYSMCQFLSIVPGMTGSRILTIAAGSGVFSSCAWVVSKKAKLAEQTGMARLITHKSFALGASGGVMGLCAVATCFLPWFRVNYMCVQAPLSTRLMSQDFYKTPSRQVD